MAEGLLRTAAPDRFCAYSAGALRSGVNPRAVQVMEELGIDISHQRSKAVDEFAGQMSDYIVTLCDSSEGRPCPVFLGECGEQFHWPFDDPTFTSGDDDKVLGAFRDIRDQIKARIERFVDEGA